MEIRRTELAGNAAFLIGDAERGDFIQEYTGVYRNTLAAGPSYYAVELSGKAGGWIDATNKGGVARFINHSCDPNCVMETWLVAGEDRLGIFASRYIAPGQQLTIDYNWERLAGDAQECFCGFANCKQWIGTPPGTPGEGGKNPPKGKQPEEGKRRAPRTAAAPTNSPPVTCCAECGRPKASKRKKCSKCAQAAAQAATLTEWGSPLKSRNTGVAVHTPPEMEEGPVAKKAATCWAQDKGQQDRQVEKQDEDSSGEEHTPPHRSGGGRRATRGSAVGRVTASRIRHHKSAGRRVRYVGAEVCKKELAEALLPHLTNIYNGTQFEHS